MELKATMPGTPRDRGRVRIHSMELKAMLTEKVKLGDVPPTRIHSMELKGTLMLCRCTML